MALTPQTLAAIQAAGAAIYAADAALKEAVQSYADQVKQAMLDNPFDMGNDGLFDDWKTVARLSRAVGQVEVEFQRIYSAASDLSSEAIPSILTMPTLTAPQVSVASDLAMVQEIDATDAVIKKLPKKLTVKAKPKTKTKTKTKTKAASLKPLSGNTAKVLSGLMEILNPHDFVKINRTAVAAEIGIPKGSIGASISVLTEMGYLIEGAFGEYKLGAPKNK